MAALLALARSSAVAVDLQWDPDATPPPSGGSGNWNTTGAFWFNGTTDVPWNNANLDSAIFAGTAGTVTLTEPITAAGLQFDTAGYTITGNTLTLGGTAPTVEANTSARITSILAGTAGFTVTGPGPLVLSGANTFSGQMIVAPGAFVGLNTAGALGAAGAGNETIVQAGGTLNIGGQSINNNPPPATPGEEIRIAGTGVGGIGALINTSAGNTNTLAKVVLTADATISAGAGISTSYGLGGNIVTSAGGRTDIRVNAAPTAGQEHLDLNGFTLTKAGSHLLALVNADVSNGNIVVNDGQLNIEAGTLVQGTGTITVNPNGKLGFWSVGNAANVTRQIVVNGGTIGDPTSTGAAQTVNAPITLTGAQNPNFTAISGNVTTLAGVINEDAGSTITEVAKRGGGALAFSNIANTFDAPVTVYQGTLRGDFLTALPAGGISPDAPLTTTDTPLGTNTTIKLAGGTLALRINMADNNTQQRWDLNRAIIVDNAPSAMTFDRLSNAAQTDKHVIVDSLTFNPPTAANGFSIGQNQLTFTQANVHRLEIPAMTMNSDTVLTTGDFTLSGNSTSPGRHSLAHTGGNTIQFVGGTHEFNAFFHLGNASLRVGSGFGTPQTSDTVTLGTGTIYVAPNNGVTFRTPTNLAPGQIIELVSQQQTQAVANFEQFTSVPTNLRALGGGVIGVGNATAFGDIDLSRIGDGTFRIGSNFAGTGNGTIAGNITAGQGNVVRLGGGGTVTILNNNAISGDAALEVGSSLINGGFRTGISGGAQSGTVILAGTNDYTGGTTVNRGSTLRLQDTSAAGTGPITVFGTITPELNATFAAANGNDNAFTPTLLGGGGIHFNNGGVTGNTDVNRWGDTTPITLINGLLQITSRNDNTSTTNETVGPLTVIGGNTISLSRQNAVTGNIAQLTLNSLTRSGQATIELARTTGTGAGYGVGQKLLIANGAPTPVNGMVNPWMVAQNNGPQEFLTYDPANGFTPATYDATVTTGTYAAGTVSPNAKVDVTTTALTLTDDPTLYALRTNQNINSSGANDTITIRSGGLIGNANTGTTTIAPNVVFADGATNVEGIINSRSGGTLALTGTVTANGLTKFGAGTLNIHGDNGTTLTGTVSINQGILQTFGPTATGTRNSLGTGTIQLAGGQLNLRSNNTAVTGTINQTLQNGITVIQNLPLAVIDVNRSAADTASSGTFIFNPAAAGPGLQLLGAPGPQGQTLTVNGANYALQFGTNAQNSFAGNVTINNAVNVTLNNAPAITGTAPVITKSGAGALILGAVAGTTAPAGTQAVVHAGTLELRSLTSVGTAATTTLVLNGGALNLRRDSAGDYGGVGSIGYPVVVNANTTISTDRVGGTNTNFAEGLGLLTVNGSPTITFNSGNGIYPSFLTQPSGPSAQFNGMPILVSNVGPGGLDSAVRFNGPVSGGGFVKLGGGHLHLLGADSTYDGGTFINQGFVRARATNALGTGAVILNPGAILDLNATDNLRASQPLIIRSNSAFIPMVSVNTDIPHPAGANVDATGAPTGVVGLSNGPAGVYNTPINLSTLYGGRWSLGGVPAGVYDPTYTAATLGAGADNLYRLGGGGTSFAMGTDDARAARTNVLTGPNNVRLGFDSSNILPVNMTNFQYSMAGTNDYTGGSTVIHRGMMARLFTANNGTQSALSNSAVDVFGNLSLSGTATLATATGNTNAVTLNPGSALFFDNVNAAANGAGAFAAANVTDRWHDSAPIGLNGALLNLIGGTDLASSETVGDVTYSRGARIRVARGGTTTGTATLTLNNLLGGGAGNTLHIQTSAAGTLGGVDKVIVTNSPPPVTNGMVTPSIVNQTDNSFVTYDATNGFTNATSSTTVGGTGPIPAGLPATATVDVNATGTVALSDNATIYSLRTNRDVNVAGPFGTVTLRSGGLIGHTNNLTIQPNLVFNDGTANIEGRIYNSVTVNINGTLTANGITKFGTGNLSINVPQPNYASGWTVNSGTLQINDLQGLGQSVAGNGVTLNATQTTGGQAGANFGLTQLTLNRDTGTPELAVFTGGPITVVNEGTLRIAANVNDRNLQSPAVTLDSTSTNSRVSFTFDVPNNRFRGIIPNLTLNDHAIVRVFDSGSTADTGRVTTGVVNQLTGIGKNLTKIGNRTLELNSDNSGTFTGGSITVSQGTIRVRHNGALGSASTATTIERNATLEIDTPNFTPTGTVAQLPGSIERWNIENARGTTYTLPAGVNLQLNTNLLGARTINLTGGSVEGFLWTDHPAPAVERTVGSGVTLNLQANSFVGQQNLAQGQGYDAGRLPTVEQPFGNNITGAYLRIDGNITGAFNLTKTGLDTVMIAGAANTYNDTIVDFGTLRIGRDNALPAGRTLTTRFGGTFDLYGFDQIVAGLGTVTGSPDAGGNDLGSSGHIVNSGTSIDTLTVNNIANYTYNGTIDRNVALTKTGSGTLTLGAANTYAGDTTVGAGTLAIAGSISGSRNVDVQSGATLDVSGASGGFTVAEEQTLKGNGTVVGPVAVDGTVSPGASPGTLTLTGPVDFNPGSTLALEIDGPAAFDQLVANGVTLDGPVNLTLDLAYVPAANTPFLVLNNTGGGAIGGTSGLFTWAGPEGLLTEGEHFSVGGQEFGITYQGGTGNDVVLTYIPEPGAAVSLIGGLGLLLGLRRRRRA